MQVICEASVVPQHKTDTMVQYGTVSGELGLTAEGHDPVFYTFDPYVSGTSSIYAWRAPPLLTQRVVQASSTRQ